jgi:hypothetical protein
MIYILTLVLIFNGPSDLLVVSRIPFETAESCVKAMPSTSLKHNLPEGVLRATKAYCEPVRST